MVPIVIISLIFLLIFRMPIGLALLSSSLIAALLKGIPPTLILLKIVGCLNSFIFLAIPLFILAGKIMNMGGITKRIFYFARCLVGWIPGGLAHANVVASIIFSGMTGSALADVGGLGMIEMHSMKNAGYDREFSACVTAASSTIGPIIPPSIPLVIYGTIAEVSVGALFVAGFVPGLLMGLSLIILIYFISIKKRYPVEKRVSFKEILISFKEAFLPMLTPVIIIGGILGGVASPTEAAVLAVIYGLFLGIIVYREIKFRDLIFIFKDAMILIAVIALIMAGATAFTWIITIENIPYKLVTLIANFSINKWIFLIIINLFYLLCGSIMEPIAILIMTAPLLIPLFKLYNLNPIHMGVVLVLNLMIGLITPPFGEALFIVSKIGGIRLEILFKKILIFMIPLIIVLLLITFFPKIVMFLPTQFFKGI